MVPLHTITENKFYVSQAAPVPNIPALLYIFFYLFSSRSSKAEIFFQYKQFCFYTLANQIEKMHSISSKRNYMRDARENEEVSSPFSLLKLLSQSNSTLLNNQPHAYYFFIPNCKIHRSFSTLKLLIENSWQNMNALLTIFSAFFWHSLPCNSLMTICSETESMKFHKVYLQKKRNVFLNVFYSHVLEIFIICLLSNNFFLKRSSRFRKGNFKLNFIIIYCC